jgi:hypothetical protein
MIGRYSGVKSLDAEITVDFIAKHVRMDYSRNYTSDWTNSNSSRPINVLQWNTMPRWTRLSALIILAYLPTLIAIPYFLYQPFHHIWVKLFGITESGQYEHQEFLRYVQTILHGTVEVTKEGPMKEPSLTFILLNNLWLEYELEGDYQTHIESISLVRNFITHYKMGKFKFITQRGWKLIFTFIEPPQSGSCLVRYIE